MKIKRVMKKYIFKGFGFPVELSNVPIIEVMGDEAPYIKYNMLSEIVLREIIFNVNIKITGNHIKFIRQSLNKSLREFSNDLELSHEKLRRIEDKHKHDDISSYIIESDWGKIKIMVITYFYNKDMGLYLKSLSENVDNKNEIIKVA